MFSTSSVGAIVGTYVSVLVLLSVLASVGSIVTYIIIVVANRAEPDPTGNRTNAIYHVGTAFIALWLEIAGVITTLRHVVQPHRGRQHAEFFVRDSPTRRLDDPGVTIGLLLSIVGG